MSSISKHIKHQFFLYTGIVFILIMSGCNSSNKEKTPIVPAKGIDTIKTVVQEEIPDIQLPDSGQQYFKVVVTKNNQPLAQYEGDFPLGTFVDDNFTLQLPASKRMLKISHFLVLYFKGVKEGSFPLAVSGSEKGKPTMIFTPEKDGAYGVNTSMSTGTLNITKYSKKMVSGNCTASGKDIEGNRIAIKTSFINVKNNNLDQ
jgi:hypothetical protein